MSVARSNDGVHINYEVLGSGPLSLLLLHGWGGSAAYWRAVISHLNLSGLRVIAPSYRGHGDSDKPPSGYTLEQFAEDILATANAAGARQFVLVGFSMSGKFAQYIAAVHAERVLGLVLIGPVPASEFPVPAELVKTWCDNQQDRVAAFQQILAPYIKIPVRTELTEAYLDDFQKAARVALEETLSMCGVSFADRAGRIRVPTLVLAGEFDPLISPDLVRGTVLSQIGTARMVALPCGHEIPQELPEQTAALLEAFICGVGTSVTRGR